MERAKKIVEGKAILERKGLPRTKKSVVLPENITWLKQPNLITFMSHDFRLMQMRLLILVVEKMQKVIEESIQNYEKYGVSSADGQLSLFGDMGGNVSLEIPYKDLGVGPDQYNTVKPLIKKLCSIPVEVETINPKTGEPRWTIAGLIAKAHVEKKYSRHCIIEIDRDILKLFYQADKGFTKYIKEIAFNATSKYTIRMYMLVSSWREKGGFSIRLNKFRKVMNLGRKYKDYKDLYRWVIRPAYEELFEKANCWFEVAEVYNSMSDKEPYKLNFKVVRAVVTQKEKEFLEIQRRNIETVCKREFSMDDARLSQIITRLTLDNVARVNQKIAELVKRTEINGDSINDVCSYAFTVITKELEYSFGMDGEPLEIDEMF
ncbi:MAG: replication initiation protein [Bacteroidales bacterium]|nr:replication initiation protein [Bacteroidales bacterium]